jgi:hypothetical protein
MVPQKRVEDAVLDVISQELLTPDNKRRCLNFQDRKSRCELSLGVPILARGRGKRQQGGLEEKPSEVKPCLLLSNTSRNQWLGEI